MKVKGANYEAHIDDGGNPNCCGVCKWWDPEHEPTSENGRCKRHAPRPFPSGVVEAAFYILSKARGCDNISIDEPCQYSNPEIAHTAWPETWDTHWCGEFELAEADAPTTQSGQTTSPIPWDALSIHASKILKSLEVETVADVAALHFNEVWRCPGCRAETILEIEGTVAVTRRDLPGSPEYRAAGRRSRDRATARRLGEGS